MQSGKKSIVRIQGLDYRLMEKADKEASKEAKQYTQTTKTDSVACICMSMSVYMQPKQPEEKKLSVWGWRDVGRVEGEDMGGANEGKKKEWCVYISI